MRETFSFIKKLFDNKKTRSLAFLILYFIFFIFVFATLNNVTNVLKSNDTEKDEPLDVIDEPIKDEFFYIKDIDLSNYKIISLDEVSLDERFVDSIVIYNTLKNSKLESTNYIDESNTYIISIVDFEKKVFGNELDLLGNVRIILFKEKIVLDLSEYLGYSIEFEIGS